MAGKLFDCLVFDPGINNDSARIFQFLNNETDMSLTPVLVRSSKKMTKKEETQMKRYAKTIIPKSNDTLEQLADKTTLLLHRPYNRMPDRLKKTIEHYRLSENVLKNKKVLLVDDDVRNLFALTTALERHKINVLSAESGEEAIAILQKNTDIDIVLMDIMMPEMDGYETMKRIRKDKNNDQVTIIAVTAKAMKGDRQKCIESGASDYITKPVNVEQLVTLMNAWVK